LLATLLTIRCKFSLPLFSWTSTTTNIFKDYSGTGSTVRDSVLWLWQRANRGNTTIKLIVVTVHFL